MRCAPGPPVAGIVKLAEPLVVTDEIQPVKLLLGGNVEPADTAVYGLADGDFRPQARNTHQLSSLQSSDGGSLPRASRRICSHLQSAKVPTACSTLSWYALKGTTVV